MSANTISPIDSAVFTYVKKGDAAQTPRYMLKVQGQGEGTGLLKLYPGQCAKLAACIRYLEGHESGLSMRMIEDFTRGVEWQDDPHYCYDTYTDKQDKQVKPVLCVRRDALDTQNPMGQARLGVPSAHTLLQLMDSEGVWSVVATLDFIADARIDGTNPLGEYLRDTTPADPTAPVVDDGQADTGIAPVKAPKKARVAPVEPQETALQRFERVMGEYNALVAQAECKLAELQVAAKAAGKPLALGE